MPRDSGGIYTLPAGNPVTAGTVIEDTWANDTMSDIAVQLNNVITRDGVLNPTAAFYFDSGTAAAPGIAFTVDTNTGIYRAAADTLGISAGGVLQATFSADGIYASNAEFDVLTVTTFEVDTLSIDEVSGPTTLVLSTSAAERVRISDTGLVGINNTTFAVGYQLQVRGRILANSTEASDDGAVILTPTSDPGRTGLVEFYGSNGVRAGYIGYGTDGSTTDTGELQIVAEKAYYNSVELAGLSLQPRIATDSVKVPTRADRGYMLLPDPTVLSMNYIRLDAGVFEAGDVLHAYCSDGSELTISFGSLDLYKSGTSGPVAGVVIPENGSARIWFISSSAAVVSLY